MSAEELRKIANNDELLEVGRKAVEDLAIEFRDSGIMQMRNNGICCRYCDGTSSDVIRFGPETAIKVGLEAIANFIESQGSL